MPVLSGDTRRVVIAATATVQTALQNQVVPGFMSSRLVTSTANVSTVPLECLAMYGFWPLRLCESFYGTASKVNRKGYRVTTHPLLGSSQHKMEPYKHPFLVQFSSINHDLARRDDKQTGGPLARWPFFPETHKTIRSIANLFRTHHQPASVGIALL